MKLLFAFLSLLLCLTSYAQVIVLNPANPLDPCTSVTLGETIDFERGTNCSVDVVLLDNNDIEVFRTTDSNFSFAFTESGNFTFYCGAGPGAIALGAFCVNVEIVPTLSEWGVISLCLLMMIIGTLAVHQRQEILLLS